MQAISLNQLMYYKFNNLVAYFCQYQWLQYIVLVFLGVLWHWQVFFGVCQKLILFFGIKDQGRKWAYVAGGKGKSAHTAPWAWYMLNCFTNMMKILKEITFEIITCLKTYQVSEVIACLAAHQPTGTRKPRNEQYIGL